MAKPREPKEALVGNASDAEQVRLAASREKINETERLNAWAAIDADPRLVHVLDEILDYAGVGRTPIGNSSDYTHFLVGKQDVGHFVAARRAAAATRSITQKPRTEDSTE